MSGDEDRSVTSTVARTVDERGARLVPKPCGIESFRRFVAEADARLERRRSDRARLEGRALLEQLTRTEGQVIEACLDGAEVSEIATRRGASAATVEMHVKRVVSKCGFASRQHMVRHLLARRRGAELIRDDSESSSQAPRRL
ncbi:MAG TPA: LuxR C-terminal-related transcriptional regulator [Sandaracinaceae bacterium LLY-WYZ-13_1]|nr:LuxR C-terminal-related transcriptional regulator [Sandaracinaceae bacterium LLY-WYZ-13_1]